tara:strand:- start:2287 stop:2703 length:417 start_codon:yes stop_codon:yes gene_type:complete
MSEIITNKLTGKTAAGDVTVTNGTATQKLQDGVIHTSAGVNQNSSSWFGTTQNTVATGSLNVSSMTDHSTGNYGLNLTNTAANLNTQKFAGMIGHTNNSITIDDNSMTTSRFDFETNDSDSNQTTDHYSTTMVSGDLA